MPKNIYTVELEGKQYDIEGDREPTEQEIRNLVGGEQELVKTPVKEPLGMPGYSKTEAKIAQRKDPVQVLMEELQYNPSPLQHPIDALLKQPTTLIKALNVPFGRLESTIASGGIAAQKGDYNQILSEAVKGISGQRQAQLGDIMRNVGAPEPLAAAIGMGGMAGLLSPKLVVSGTEKLVQPISKGFPGLVEDFNVFKSGMQSLKTGIQNMLGKPQMPKSDKLLLEQAQKSVDISQKAVNSVNSDINTIREATNDVPANTKDVQSTFDKLFRTSKGEELMFPEGLSNEFKDIIGAGDEINLDKIYKIKDTIKGKIHDSTWVKKGMGVSPEQERLYDSYFGFDKIIDDSMSNVGLLEEKQLLDLANQKATQVYKLSRAVDKMTKGSSQGTVRDPSKLYKIFTGGAEEAGNRAIFSTLSEIEPQMEEVVNTMLKIRNSVRNKMLLKRAGLLVGAEEAIRWGRKLLK